MGSYASLKQTSIDLTGCWEASLVTQGCHSLRQEGRTLFFVLIQSLDVSYP
jgi:hypothetical protein